MFFGQKINNQSAQIFLVVKRQLNIFLINLFYIQIKMHLGIDDSCSKQYEEMKLQKTVRHISFKIENEKIVIQKVGERSEGWDQFLDSLPHNEFRYCVYDFEFINHDQMHQSKLIFINWNPDQTPLKKRVLYATAKESFKSHIKLNTKDFTISSKNDMTEQEMIKELSK